MKMERINTEVFLKVVEMGSFQKAADSLGYTQAGVSYIINTMEKKLDINLFMRKYGGVYLTSEGKLLLPLIREMDSSQKAVENKISQLKELKSGTIKIASFSSVMINWLPDIIYMFTQDYPDIEFDLQTCDDRSKIESLICNMDIDLGFVPLPAKRDFDTIHLAYDPMLAIVSYEHPLADLEKFPLSEIQNYDYIDADFYPTSETSEIFKAAGVALPPATLRNTSDYAVMAMVAKNFGYSIFPKLLLKNVPFPVKCMEFDKPVSRALGIGVNSFSYCSNIANEFIKYTEKWVQEYSGNVSP